MGARARVTSRTEAFAKAKARKRMARRGRRLERMEASIFAVSLWRIVLVCVLEMCWCLAVDYGIQ